MRNSSTENCRDLTLKSNTGMASVYSYRNLLRVEQINNLWNTKYWEAHFHHFPPLCYSKCIAKEEWEWNWSLTAVHIFKLYSMYSFTMNWLGTELVWNFLTKVIFFFQEKKKKSNLEGIMYPSAIPNQWYSLLPQFNKSQKIRKFTWGRFPNSSPQASCFTGMTRTNHQGIFPFKYSLELFHLILITGNVLQKGRKKAVGLATFYDYGRH